MAYELSQPLFSLTIGEFIELCRSIFSTVTKENNVVPIELPDEHLTIRQCAKFLNCSKVSIHSYKKKGLPFYKVGRKVLFRKSEVLEFMKNHGKRLIFRKAA